MRTHIEKDIFISSTPGGLGFTIDKLVTFNVYEKGTKNLIGQEEKFDTVSGGNFTTLSGAVKGLLHHKVVNLSNDTILSLNELSELIRDYKKYVESKLEI